MSPEPYDAPDVEDKPGEPVLSLVIRLGLGGMTVVHGGLCGSLTGWMTYLTWRLPSLETGPLNGVPISGFEELAAIGFILALAVSVPAGVAAISSRWMAPWALLAAGGAVFVGELFTSGAWYFQRGGAGLLLLAALPYLVWPTALLVGSLVLIGLRRVDTRGRLAGSPSAIPDGQPVE